MQHLQQIVLPKLNVHRLEDNFVLRIFFIQFTYQSQITISSLLLPLLDFPSAHKFTSYSLLQQGDASHGDSVHLVHFSRGRSKPFHLDQGCARYSNTGSWLQKASSFTRDGSWSFDPYLSPCTKINSK